MPHALLSPRPYGAAACARPKLRRGCSPHTQNCNPTTLLQHVTCAQASRRPDPPFFSADVADERLCRSAQLVCVTAHLSQEKKGAAERALEVRGAYLVAVAGVACLLIGCARGSWSWEVEMEWGWGAPRSDATPTLKYQRF